MWVVDNVVVLFLCFVSHAAAAGSEWAPPNRLGAVGEWNPEFYADFWPGVCATGEAQSPLNLPGDQNLMPLPDALQTTWGMPTVQEPIITHTGHAVQVSSLLLVSN